jgi:hypothetical protein
MESVEQQVERLMSLNADTELRFDDGDLEANSKVLSSVLRNAVEAHTAGDVNSSARTSNSSSTTIMIPIEGVTKQQWLAVAPFWHPVTPAPVVKTWAEAELLLRIGSRFELHPALDKARDYLLANLDKLTPSSSSSASGSASAFGATSTFTPAGGTSPMPAGLSAPAAAPATSGFGQPAAGLAFGQPAAGLAFGAPAAAPATAAFGQPAAPPGTTRRWRCTKGVGSSMADSCVWKWLLLGDELCLSSCIPALIKKAVAIDRPGCRSLTNTQGLSAPVLQQLVAELA